MWFFKKKDKKEDENPDNDAVEAEKVETTNIDVAEEQPEEAIAEAIAEPVAEPVAEVEAIEPISIVEPKEEKSETIVVAEIAEDTEEQKTTEAEDMKVEYSSEDKNDEIETEQSEEKKDGWFKRLRHGLNKSSNKITGNISSVLTKRKLDEETIEELEEALIMADLGPVTAAKLIADLSKGRFGKDITDLEVREILAESMEAILAPVAKPLRVDDTNKPHVILFSGVNGAGKTTTIGKLAAQFKKDGKSVMMAAGDTFRAAAVEQLKIWGDRSNCPVVSKDIGADAGALAYEAYEQAKEQNMDILLIDTAGRLQNKTNLMEELEKVVRVLKKHDETAPHDIVLVLDATTGQNAHSQVELFDKSVNITGLVVTKLDGTAKGGVIISLAERFKKPVHAIGVGESINDLRSFDAKHFAHMMMGLHEK